MTGIVVGIDGTPPAEAALAFLTLTHLVRIWHLMTIAALLGVVNAFDIPGRQSFVVQLVAREDLQNAIALNSSMFNGARVVGPAIAGILVAVRTLFRRPWRIEATSAALVWWRTRRTRAGTS